MYNREAERREVNRNREAAMNVIAPTHPKISKGSFVAVEVLGIPGKTGSDAVLTYEAHADVEVGELIRVPAPGWTIRVTGHDELPGFVLGLVDSTPLDRRVIRTTLPLTDMAGTPDTSALSAKVDAWRSEAAAFRAAAASIDRAADDLSAALTRV